MAKFKKGESGNPSGRPKGTTTASKVRKQIESSIPEVIDNVVSQALAGDLLAARILIDRVCPSLKPQALPIQIPTGDNLAGSGANAIEATFTGGIPPDVGAMLIKALSEQGRLVESQEIIERLARLEQMMEAK